MYNGSSFVITDCKQCSGGTIPNKLPLNTESNQMAMWSYLFLTDNIKYTACTEKLTNSQLNLPYLPNATQYDSIYSKLTTEIQL